MRILLLLTTLLLLICSCQQSASKAELQPLDLLKHGIPITINAPDSAVVRKSKIGDWDDVTIKKDNYSLQIFVRGAETSDMKKIMADELALVKSERFFSKIVKEEDKGFIYETSVDSIPFYNFKYLHYQADKIYTFQKGLADNITLEQAEKIYTSVKQGK